MSATGGSTLPLRSELRRQLGRRRTQVVAALLVVLPFLLVGAFALGDDEGPGSGAPALVDLATSGAGNFAFFVLFAVSGFLLSIVVALLAGDTVAAEASWSSLRYLLAAPVPRSRLLRQKLIIGLFSAGVAIAALLMLSLIVGWAFYGSEPLTTPFGTRLDAGQALGRLAIAAGYVIASLFWVGAAAFLFGTVTDAPLGAVGGAVLLVILSNILDTISALGDLRNGLPTHYSYAWLDVFGAQIAWDAMLRGALWSVLYATVALLIAWWHFGRKDIVS